MKRIAIFICLSLVTFHVWAQSDRREDRAKRWSYGPYEIRLTTPVRRDTIIAGDRRVIQSSAAKLFSYEGECKLDKKTNIWVDGGIVWGRYGGDTADNIQFA
ncbi:MAG: hypothetical protein IK143_01560 [Bacteroidales bacterium]|nr:hypothetical protein [Bacteroidales bacterium]